MKTLTLCILAALAQDASREETLAKIESTRITVDFQDLRVSQVVDYLRDLTGLNLALSPRVLERDAERTVRLKARDLSVRSVLRHVLQGRGLSLTFRDGVLLVVPSDELRRAVTCRLYDVRAHMVKIQDFPGPRVELKPVESGEMGIICLAPLEAPKQMITDEFLVETVKANTGGSSWTDNSDASMELRNGILVVTQTAAVHQEIRTLLSKLEQYR